MKPVTAAVAGALISGVAMYTLGARTENVEAFTQEPAAVATLDGQLAQARPVATVPVKSFASAPARRSRTAASPQQPVYRPVERESREEARQGRTWQKTALIIGGSAASGAGVGAIVDGKKGALIGAAIGGGAASIYEATRRQ